MRSPFEEDALRAVVRRWLEQRVSDVAGPIELVDGEVLVPGRPGLLDVVADVGGTLVHPVFALRREGDEARVIGTVDDAALGTLHDAAGEAVVLDALHDAHAARALLDLVVGSSASARSAPRTVASSGAEGTVSVSREDSREVVLTFDHDLSLTVFLSLSRTPDPGVALLAGLDEAGFNHLAAPVAFWRRSGMDLGLVQEALAGASNGWAFALASLRDLVASGGAPEDAGGDFAPEAFSLGTMTARMHLALDRAFGHRDAPGPRTASSAEPGSPESSGLVMRTHGDFGLGKVARTDHGWVLSDPMPGGGETASGEPLVRGPLEDVADFTRSLHEVAAAAAAERGPGPPPADVRELVGAWEARNRRAFLSAYLAAPGIGSLLPTSRGAVRRQLAGLERARARARDGEG